MGYGKSHMLAALVCLLVRVGERVIYLPDCRSMLQDPLDYLRKAFLLAFRDDDRVSASICGCNNYDDLVGVSKQYLPRRLCFIVDQLNALDPEPSGEDNVTNTSKDHFQRFILRASYSHVYISSASANHKSAKYLETRQTDDEKLSLMGGMTKVSVLFQNHFSCPQALDLSWKCPNGGSATPRTSRLSVVLRNDELKT
jgi:hypothetical protein